VTTRESKTAAARQKFEPDEKLIREISARFGLPPEKLGAVLSAFGPMPEEGQHALLDHLYLELGRYWFLAKSVRVTPWACPDFVER
jgi:hypothetical protein